MSCINKPIISLGNRLSSNFLFHFLRSLLHSWVTFLPPTLQHKPTQKSLPQHVFFFQSQYNTCAVGTVSLPGVFYMFSLSHLPGSRREEDKGGPVALDSVTRELPVLEACKPGDTWDPAACRVSLATSLLSRDGADFLLAGCKSRHCSREMAFTDLRPSSKRTYHHGFSCWCVPQERVRDGTVSSRQMLFFNSSLQKMKFGLLFWIQACFLLVLFSLINLNYCRSWWF